MNPVTGAAPPAFHHLDAGTPESVWASARQWRTVAALDAALWTQLRRVVVVAAHPDDETLGAGGLIATAAQHGLETVVVVLTDGEASHPHSPTATPARLAALRRSETRAAVGVLHPGARTVFVGVPDGEVANHETACLAAVVEMIGEGGDTLVVAPWRSDGHPDHDAAGRLSAVAASRTDATLLEYPIWLWHWGTPDASPTGSTAAAAATDTAAAAQAGAPSMAAAVPWAELRTLPLSPDVHRAKARALRCHVTQVAPLSPAAGDEALLHPDLLDHFRRHHETFIISSDAVDDRAFDELHEEHFDPWAVESSWYEQRKRALTLAALPQRRYGRALEIGCSVGLLARDLATRSDEMIAIDRSSAALARAADNLRDHHDCVALHQAAVPDEWPDGIHDLVVVSEVGYFLSPRELDRLMERAHESLAPGGTVVLCHWRHPISGWPLDGERVHARWRARHGAALVAEHREPDFLLDVYVESERVETDARPDPDGPVARRGRP